MTFQDLQYLHALNTIPGVGAQKFRLLLGALDDGQGIWNASQAQLLQSGIGPALSAKIAAARPHIDIARKWAELAQAQISVLSWESPVYPALLKEIPNSPYLIYTRGNLKLLECSAVAIVGSRAHTPYGKQAAYGLAQDLARAGVVVVSGLALGIDAVAHRGALDAQGGTIAVLGNSLDDASIAPRANFHLAQEILAKDGLLLSEYPPITPAGPGTFPARNRIMAGLANGTLVVEAAPDSGTLITANLALEFNRDVYAVPGPIGSAQSEGANGLIKKGAKLVTGSSDILEDFSFAQAVSKTRLEKDTSALSADEQKVFTILSAEPTHIDIIIKLSKLETAAASSLLSLLEMKGFAKNMGGQNYVRL